MSIVLLVDDDPRIRQSLSRLLERRGHGVRTASSRFSGLQDATDDPPDVVVLDLGLPDVDGFELLKMLRAVCAVPVIVATARDDEPSSSPAWAHLAPSLLGQAQRWIVQARV